MSHQASLGNGTRVPQIGDDRSQTAGRRPPQPGATRGRTPGV